MQDGIGIHKWTDGRTYEGEFSKDRKHGYGIFRWLDGRQYTGYWANGKQHGLGIYTKLDENKVRYGLWEDGKVVEWFKSGHEIFNTTNYDFS